MHGRSFKSYLSRDTNFLAGQSFYLGRGSVSAGSLLGEVLRFDTVLDDSNDCSDDCYDSFIVAGCMQSLNHGN